LTLRWPLILRESILINRKNILGFRLSGRLNFYSTYSYDSDNLEPHKVDFYCRWLYTPREDAKPRVLYLDRYDCFDPQLELIDRIKKVGIFTGKNIELPPADVSRDSFYASRNNMTVASTLIQ
jgi:hypothetical protein